MRPSAPVAACLAALLLLPLPARGAAPAAPAARGSKVAVALFAKAEESFAALRANSQAQRQRQNFTRVLEAYRRVFEKYPATRQGEESLMRAGELLTLLFRWTGQEGDLNRAQNTTSASSRRPPRALWSTMRCWRSPICTSISSRNPARAWLRFRDVTQLAPGGDKEAEAKRQLRRLARYAAPEKPVPAAGPVAASAPAVLAAPPPPVIAMPPPAIISMPPAASPLPPSPGPVRGRRRCPGPQPRPRHTSLV